MLNPFKPSDPWPRSHHDLIEHYYAQYDKQIASGEYQPFLYPWGTLGAVVVIAYLLIPHQNRPWLKNARFLAFTWIAGFAIYSIRYTRAKGMAPALGIGLISAWSVAWVSAILVCNDAQTDFQRIERLEGAFGGSKNETKEKDSKSQDTESSTAIDGHHNVITSTSPTNDMVHGHEGPSHRHGTFAWQPYPLTPFIERLDWVLDIFCNFRGAGWNWRTSALPPPPKSIQEQLHLNSGASVPKSSSRTHTGQVKLHPSRSALLRSNLQTFLTGYLTLDILKTLMMHDPYFWGLVSRPPPAYLPFALFSSSPILTHTFHLALSMLAVKTALQTIFSLGPLFFSGLLSPSLIGARAEHWMYPETWAPYSVVLDKGLAGWWGSWWHQTFRFAFQEPSRKVLELLGKDKRSAVAKAGQLVTAFGLSGIVHACGSYTCAGDTRPVRGPIAFFMAQALGIFAEVLGSQALRGVGTKVPRTAKQAFTFMYVHVWFYFTAHLLCDDFARGGVWLFEPVPVSLFRGLGFGADARDGWWCWWGLGEVNRWHSGDTWWTTGIAF
ncbi:hypothetical protein CC86DRAFT_450157 [Ophiobolus disseminans]|uniref:Wax synthase domain-containing protein n=1 Tax=Ophiobolus disseminans TaxID=1469910 RepID=A0A6A6ZFZ6_9PLEO|nr:hypothetical protein CC86DRAFT_450157 [Ophiobolus disseminans]